MKTLEHSIEIDAPADRTWATLIDFGSYETWNPFLRVSGDPERGRKLTVQIRPGTRLVTFRPTVTAFEPGRRVRWLGRFVVPGIFDGDHELRVESLGPASSRFTQREQFSGLLVPVFGGVLRDTAAGFEAMNLALKARVEAARPAGGSA